MSITYYSLKFLNTNKEIIAMSAGPLDPAKNNDILFIGSKTNLLAYSKISNKSLIF